MALWEKFWAEFMVWHGQQHVHIKHHHHSTNKNKQPHVDFLNSLRFEQTAWHIQQQQWSWYQIHHQFTALANSILANTNNTSRQQ